MFILWHRICRIAFPLLFILCGVGLFLPRVPWINLVLNIAFITVCAIGATSALLILALRFFGFRFSCPQCRGKNTAFGMHEKRFWLNCDDCGLTEETGPLNLHLEFTPKAELDQE